MKGLVFLSFSMSLIDFLKLILLAAIWGSSFVFMRVIAPVLGPVVTADLRILLAGVVLFAVALYKGFKFNWKKNIFKFTYIGVLSLALPFSFFSYAAMYIPASYSVVLNSTTPLFGVLLAAFMLKEKITLPKLSGVALGMLGVFVIANVKTAEVDEKFLLSVVLCLVAAALYAYNSIYVKLKAAHISPLILSSGSQIMGGLMLALAIPVSPAISSPSLNVILCLLFLAIICTAVAMLLYYQLLESVGPTKSLTVTFLMPVFGIIWGNIFLGEVITLRMVYGSLLILAGTGLVLYNKVQSKKLTNS